jgi:SAM-dependent methyltransferase
MYDHHPAMTASPGRPAADNQAAELAYWAERGIEEFDHHLKYYRAALPLDRIDYRATRILDVGSGAISVFENIAPATAAITPYDTLAADYNRIAPGKKFPISGVIPDTPFDLITLFNCLDHMDEPGELLTALRPRLAPTGHLWITCHVDRPWGEAEHPQDFRFWHLIALVQREFDLVTCNLIREGAYYPYLWHCIARPRTQGGAARLAATAFFNLRCALTYARFHACRAGAAVNRRLRGTAAARR